jgi:hypothetical protein
MAARRLAPGERVLDIRAAEDVEGYEVRSVMRDGSDERRVLTDTPPRDFIEGWNGEHGEVRVAPLIDTLLRRVRSQKKG